MRKALIALALAAFLAPPAVAMAQEIPEYDINAFCESIVAPSMAGAEQIKQACISGEELYRDKHIPIIATDAPPQVIETCKARNAKGGAYGALFNCIAQEKKGYLREEAGKVAEQLKQLTGESSNQSQ